MLEKIHGWLIVGLMRLPFNKPFFLYLEYSIKVRMWYSHRKYKAKEDETFLGI